MKKILIFSCMLLFSGCTLFAATPTTIVEDFLGKYQSLDTEVTDQLDDVVADDDLSDAQKEIYKDIIEKQYKDLTYTIKEEIIDADSAIVKVEIEVYDFNKSINDAADYLLTEPDELFNDDNSLIVSDYIDYKMDLMDDESERIKYTLNLSLSKTDGKWTLDDLSDEQKEKIHGIYDYD